MRQFTTAMIGLFMVLMLSCLPGLGQNIQNKCQYRNAWLTVISHANRLINGLNPDNFQIRVHGHFSRVLGANQLPIRHILIILDASGSMGPGNQRLSSRKAAEELLNILPARQKTALFIFGVKTQNIATGFESAQNIAHQLNTLKIQAGGRSTVYASLIQAFKTYPRMKAGDLIFLFSNCKSRPYDFKLVRKLFLKKSIRLFCFVPFYGPLLQPPQSALPFQPQSAFPMNTIAVIARESGGQAISFSPQSSAPIYHFDPLSPMSLRAIMVLARYSYILRIKLNKPHPGALNWKIKIINTPLGAHAHYIRAQHLSSCRDTGA